MQLGKICAAVPCEVDREKEGPMTAAYERRILRVIDHIHDNPAGDLSLDALASVAALSRFHFHRVFRAVIGETASQSVRRIRLHRAAVHLAQSDQPLADIARMVGYPNLSSFTRAFSDAYGMTPLAFRNRGELRPMPRPFTQIPSPEVFPMFPVAIRPFPALRLAAMPHKGAYFEINRAFQTLTATMAARGLFAQAGRMVAVFYDDPNSVLVTDLRSHAGFEIVADTAIDPPLEVVHMTAARHAVLTYTGPYAGLPAAYDQLYSAWLPGSGEEPADTPSFEIYLNSPMDTAPEKQVTELCLPLKG
jgi:AraC family transcriptional regulator